VHDRRHARGVRIAGAVVALTATATIVSETAAGQESQPSGWPQFQGGPGHEGVRDDGPEPPYRVRWSMADPSGEGFPPIIVVDDVAVAVGRDAVYGVGLSDGAISWEIPRQGGPLSAPAVSSVRGDDVLVYLDGPATASADDDETATASPTTAAATGPETTTASPGPDVGNGEAPVTELVAVTLSDRTERWRVELDAMSRSGVTIEGDSVYVGDQGGMLSAYGLGNGERRWSAEVAGRIDTPVAVAEGSVYVAARDSEEVRVTLVAFDAATGERSWAPVTVPATSTAGSALSAAEGRLFMGSADRVVRAVSAQDGTEQWRALVLSLFSPTTAPAIADGSVFMADFGGGIYRLDAGDGDRTWSHQLNEVILRGVPVVSGNAVLVGVNDGRLVALDAVSGHIVWERDLTEGSLGAIAIGDDVVVAATGGPEAGLVALETDPEGTLVDVPSPTDFDPGTTFARYAAAAAIVFVGAFVPGVLLRRRVGSRMEHPGENGEAPDAEAAIAPDDEDADP
jgi:outer membrane protein assembly factor BamB